MLQLFCMSVYGKNDEYNMVLMCEIVKMLHCHLKERFTSN